jgi:hypothetical protein
MIKKVFVGVVLAVIFILLVLGAVNRTFAKVNDRTPLSLEEKTLENKSEKQTVNQSLRLEKNASRSENSKENEDSKHSRLESSANRVNSDGNTNHGRQGNDGVRQFENSTREESVRQADWVDLNGELEEMRLDSWIIRLVDGTQIELEGHPLSYLIEQGFVASLGDKLAMSGFFEDEHFKVGHIVNQNTGLENDLRDEMGHPLWAGNGWRNN